jgi:hypothetical protein
MDPTTTMSTSSDSRNNSPSDRLRGGHAPLAINPGPLRSVLQFDGGARGACPVSPRSDGERTLETMMRQFISDEQRAQLLDNGAASARGEERDPYPVVKLFTPDAGATWLLTELSQDGDDGFGLCDLGLGFPELGRVSLASLASIRGPHGQLVERDLYFQAKYPLSEYVRRAQADGSIND